MIFVLESLIDLTGPWRLPMPNSGVAEINNWVYGCTYETATNYNAEATFDDGSCEFLWGDMNHDGTLNVQDVIFIVNAILSGDWF